MLERVWGCSWRSVPVALGMRLGEVPRALGCSMTSVPGVLGISSLGPCLGLWECALALIPRAFGMLSGVSACSFGNAPWGQSPGLWGCSSRTAPGAHRALGMWESIPSPAGHGGEEKPLFPPLPAPPGSLAARSLLRLPAEASHATRSSYDNAES